jgi:RNA polymerase sigma-70 factor (ECF subfamily)
VLLRHQGRCDVLLIDGGLDGSVRELRQLANPDKLTRISLDGP